MSDIVNSIQLIESFVKDIKSFSENENDSKTKGTVERHLGIIGEAINQLEKVLNSQNKSLEDSNLPIRSIIEMRNILIHEYFNVDLELVWSTVQEDLQNLKEQISRLASH